MPRSEPIDQDPATPAGAASADRRPARTHDSHAVRLPGRRRMARALFAPGGPLVAYPGPAAAIAHGDLVLAANPAAETLLDALFARRSGELRLAVEAALSGAPAQLQPLLLPSGGKPAALELLVLPFPDADAALLLGRDVTLERTLRAALVDSRQRYKDLVEASSDFAWETGPDGRFAFVSPGGAFDYRAEELVGSRPRRFVVAAEGGDPDFPFLAQAPLSGVELWFRKSSGEPACLVAACRPVFDEAGRWRGTRGVCRDVTESRNREAELARLRHRERLLAYLVRSIRYEVDPRNAAAAAGVAALPALAAEGCRVHRREPDGRFSVVTECGSPPPEAETEALAALAAGDTEFERAADGRAILAVPIGQGRRPAGAVVLWRPIGLGAWDADDRFLVTELAEQLEAVLQQIASQEALAMLSRTDSLTGLVNRRSFVGGLQERLAGPASRRGALLYIDLDHFKPVNDRLGHASGDAVLVLFARLLRECTRSSDLVGRLGGDEFVAWLEGIDEEAAAAKARDILRRVDEDLQPQSAAVDLPLGASIGVALSSADRPESAEELIARADAAMYCAKRAGKRRFVVAPEPTPGPLVTAIA